MTEAGERALFDRLGIESLAYLLAADVGELEARRENPFTHQLNERQERVLGELVTLDTTIQPRRPGGDNAAEWTSFLATASDPNPDVSLGNLARTMSGGSVPSVDTGLGGVEGLLTKMAIDCYPGLLVREPDDPFGFPRSLSRALFRHPANQAFQDLARSDDDLGRVFTEESEHTGPTGSVLRSTGNGGTLQLWSLAETLISSGWIAASTLSNAPTIDKFTTAVLDGLNKIRAAIDAQPVRIPARVGLAGMLLPEEIEEVDLGWGRLRRSDERDAPYIRAAGASGQLTGTDEFGETAVINYHGDLVLEIEVPYSLRIRSLDVTQPWPESLLVSARAVEAAVENLRLGLLLAFPDRRAVVHVSWQTQLDPLSSHRLAGWNDLTRAVGLMPMNLSSPQIGQWRDWAIRVQQHRTPSTAVAVRRMLASVAERRTMEDVLVDAVIVWENLFGAKTETTLRVCSSLAWLLGTSADDRKARLARYKKIYAFRSAVVHGAASINQQQLQEFALESVEISMDALRAIFESRPELLAIPTSEERSLEIMHSGS
ncbi:hypothetical protein WDJ51_15330 [Rathayibacter sp. YIM 133350]|uniref:hypothetical protein n=1 Tax=Rathayibacter sp. YIM 133350 TaxID=3131992 RepID=UPI00307F4122